MAASAWYGKIQKRATHFCIESDAFFPICFSSVRKEKHAMKYLYLLGNRFASATWWRGKRIINMMWPQKKRREKNWFKYVCQCINNNKCPIVCVSAIFVVVFEVPVVAVASRRLTQKRQKKNPPLQGEMWRLTTKMTASTVGREGEKTAAIALLYFHATFKFCHWIWRVILSTWRSHPTEIEWQAHAHTQYTHTHMANDDDVTIDYIKCYKYPY